MCMYNSTKPALRCSVCGKYKWVEDESWTSKCDCPDVPFSMEGMKAQDERCSQGDHLLKQVEPKLEPKKPENFCWHCYKVC